MSCIFGRFRRPLGLGLPVYVHAIKVEGWKLTVLMQVMCSYNRINQTYGCQNSKTQNGILKGELGFQGYVMSDWGATHSGVAAVASGEDMDMPGTPDYPIFFHDKISEAVNNGSLTMDRLDDMCRRVMAPYFQLKQDKGFPAMDPSNKELNAVLFSSRKWPKCILHVY
jgi:beta-glucosidase